MISREVEVASYKDVCGGEKRRINFGYFNFPNLLRVENNEFQDYPTEKIAISDILIWEIFSIFFSSYNIEPDFQHCHHGGHYDEDLGGWTGCMGKV